MFTMRQISEAIFDAVQRGVKVRMIADSSMIATSGSQINKLQAKGKIEWRIVWFRNKRFNYVKCLEYVIILYHFNFKLLFLCFPGVAIRIAGNGDKYMHNKFCLIDVLYNESGADENTHPVKGILINGSMNWTTNVRENELTLHTFLHIVLYM